MKLKKCINIIRSNLWWLDIIFCIVLGFAFATSKYYLAEGDCKINILIIAQAIIITICFILLTVLFRWLFTKLSREKLVKERFNKIFEIKKYAVLKIAGIIFICWIPILCMLWPGTCINDTWGQLQSIIRLKDGVWSISVHHPIFDTFIMSSIILPIAYKTGKWHLAMFVYVLLQAIATSFAFSYSIMYAKRKLKLNNIALFCFLLIYCLLPIYPLSVQTISKDALFSWIYVLFYIGFIEIIRTKGDVLNNRKFIIKFIGTLLLCALAKKTATYIIIFSLGILLIFLYRYWKKIIMISAIFSVIMLIIIPNIYIAFSIKPSGKQEMFSLLFQQTARYVKNNPEEVTEQERKVIDKVLVYNTLGKVYNPTNADNVKGYTQRGKDSDYIEYIKVWFKQGMKKPRDYIGAMNSMLAGWFSFSEYKPLNNMDWHNQLNPKLIPDWVPVRESFFENTSDIVNKVYDYLYKMPIIKLLFTYGFYASVLPAFVISTLLRRKKYFKNINWIVIVPLGLSIIIGCWLAPVSVHIEGMRYLYPVIYSLPMALMWCIYSCRDNLCSNKEDNVIDSAL